MKLSRGVRYLVVLTVVLGLVASTAALAFYVPPSTNPGVGTPGYWKNHADAWPVDVIVIGGEPYDKDDAIAIMRKPTKKDMSTLMFMHLVAAKLNVLIGNDASEVWVAIADADAWMAANPLGDGENVSADSEAWETGEPIKDVLDAYNNGELNVPARD